MGEPLSTIAGAVGIFGVAAHSLHVVYNDIDAIRGTPKEIKILKEELKALETIFVESQARNTTNENASLATPIHLCREACDRFNKKLAKWTKHSSDGKVQFRDAVYIALCGQRQVEILSKQLQSCKTTIIVAAVLRAPSGPGITENEPNLQNRERELESEINEINNQLQELQLTQNETQIVSANTHEQDTEVESDNHSVQAVIIAEVCALREQLQEELRATHKKRTGQTLKDIDLGENSRGYVGQFNLSGNAGVDQEISNLKAGNNFKGIVGMANNVNFDNLFN